MPTLVTVIIPTYNWSTALRISITSVLAQTHREFELLVVGDCCTDNSEGVTLSFGDSRVQWHNLPTRHTNQSGPNNYGIGIASGSLIAYLGHDDVWHPDHLRSLVEKIEETGAELACGVTAIYGPQGSGMRMVTGIFPEGVCRRPDFAPPSSIMHRRSLTDRIGVWGNPAELVQPVDCDLMTRAYDAGARLVSTERLTVFKFHACARRDCYVLRDTTEQSRMLARLQADPARCVEEEWAGLIRAWREHRLGTVSLPSEWSGAPGERHRANLIARGVEAPASEELHSLRRFTLEDQLSTMDWYPVETSPEWGSYRWSGPAPSAMLILPVSVSRNFELRVQILNWLGVDVDREVTLFVAGRKVEFTLEAGEGPAIRLKAHVEGPRPGPLRVEVTATRMRCLNLESEGRNPDIRWLGVCVNWIEIEPVAPTDLPGAGRLRSLLSAQR